MQAASRPAIALVAMLAACAHNAPQPPPVIDTPPTETVDEEIPPEQPPPPPPVHVELYLMSKCPYGTQLENNFGKLREMLGANAVELEIDYIGTNKGGKLSSMHGTDELAGDLFQVCTRRYSEKWFELILCQNQDLANIAANGASCAKRVGVDPQTVHDIVACAGNDEGTRLLAASFQRSMDRGAKSSPTLYIEGAEDKGDRKPEALAKRICAAKPAEAPLACASIPLPPTVNVTVLNDKRGPDPRPFNASFRSKIANPVVTELDYASPPGQALFAKIGPTTLPVIVFDATLAADKDASAAFASRLKHVADVDVITVGSWNPLCADDGGCKLAECKQRAFCRAETPKTLEIFVTSRDPQFVRALPHLVVAMDNFKKHKAQVALTIHHVGEIDASGAFSSLRGQTEVDEDLRQVCALEHFKANDAFLDYMLCRANNPSSQDWQACTGGTTGISEAVMKKCAEGPEGKRLLEASFAFSKSAAATNQLSWLVNGKFEFSGIDAQKIKTSVCDHNAKLAGCDVLLPGP